MKKIFAAFFILLFVQITYVFCQTADNDLMLAQQYMKNGEYEKAAVIYKKAFNDNSNSPSIYKNYYTCLLALNDYKEVEKIIEKQMKKNPDNLTYYVDLGYNYARQLKTSERDKIFRQAISKITNQKPQVIQLANAFLNIDEPAFAIETYEKGKKTISDYTFNYELANLYFRSGNIEKSIQLYLDYLNEDDENFNKVTNALQRITDDENNNIMLQTLLYEHIQKSDKPVFTELLAWDFIQQKDFEGAFIQIKSLDKKYKENGKRVFELAETAEGEKNYDAAIKCYTYIVEKGIASPYYFMAKNGILNCRKQKIFEINNYTQQDIDALKNAYLNFLREYSKNDYRAAMVTNDMAKLQAFYNHKTGDAIVWLEDVITWPALTPAQKSEIKLTLGDLYLINGNIWDATLIYSQVDKSMKDAPLGEEARFKNAKLAYYRGDFSMAQGQLKVLKASTSELVANDAMKLSVFITENLGLDTIADPMLLFSQADLLFFQNKPDSALIILDTLQKKYPGHSLTDDMYYMRYQIAMQQKDITGAVNYLEQIRQNYAYDLLADDALFALAELYEFQLKDMEKAKQCYEELIFNHKDSLYTNEARTRYRELRGDKLN